MQWDKFSEFYTRNSGLPVVLDDVGPVGGASLAGHAVVLTRCRPDRLTFMNSWGLEWGNGGFFSISNAGVLSNPEAPMRFFDVFFTLKDLSPGELKAYDEESARRLAATADACPSVLRLDCRCPLCEATSALREFTGHVAQAKCPRCGETFKPTADHLIRALYNSQQ